MERCGKALQERRNLGKLLQANKAAERELGEAATRCHLELLKESLGKLLQAAT
jgi:hypothetical protein